MCKEQKRKLESDLISRQGVIDAIEGTVWYRINKNGEMVSGSTNEHESWYKHDDIMIILKTIPSPPVEPKPVCEDAISREDAIEAVRLETGKLGRELLGRGDILDIISALPPVEPERPRGEWITKSTGGEMFDCCSACGYVEWDVPKNYCPNCGADMRGDKE